MCVWFHGILLRIFAHKLWNMQKCYAASETVTILFSLRHVQAANPGFTWENGRINDACVVHVRACMCVSIT